MAAATGRRLAIGLRHLKLPLDIRLSTDNNESDPTDRATRVLVAATGTVLLGSLPQVLPAWTEAEAAAQYRSNALLMARRSAVLSHAFALAGHGDVVAEATTSLRTLLKSKALRPDAWRWLRDASVEALAPAAIGADGSSRLLRLLLEGGSWRSGASDPEPRLLRTRSGLPNRTLIRPGFSLCWSSRLHRVVLTGTTVAGGSPSPWAVNPPTCPRITRRFPPSTVLRP